MSNYDTLLDFLYGVKEKILSISKGNGFNGSVISLQESTQIYKKI